MLSNDLKNNIQVGQITPQVALDISYLKQEYFLHSW